MGQTEEIVLGGGCFWCTEAIFQRIKGVEQVIPGYAGGESPNPSYQEVSTGQTGHAEVVKIAYVPQEISLETLLKVFWLTHNPTTPNRQGADIGPQYRSIILYQNKEQQQIAQQIKEEMQTNEYADSQIVTEIAPLKNFYPAEDYHQSYYQENSQAPYCQAVIWPKLKKLPLVLENLSTQLKSN